MSVVPTQLLIETDVLADCLLAAPGEQSMLREALQTHVCYTTMLNALELFRAATDSTERALVLQLLHLVRVLGFNARTAEPYSELAEEIERTTGQRISDRDIMILGMARASKLAILTRTRFRRYAETKTVQVLSELSPVVSAPQTSALDDISSSAPHVFETSQSA